MNGLKLQIEEGDCLDILRNLPNNCVDSLVTDPPAGISFMGKAWDDNKGGRDQWVLWMTDVMRECLRVMKPGAHGLVWAIPRTSHWTATALENAGFEVRDVVTHLFGTGFPKSLDISKAIDKAAGAKREVIGSKLGMPGYSLAEDKGRTTMAGKMGYASECEIISAATSEAKQWEGWGTALKPASEHWILVRKPLSESTVAKNVLKWGTGGINIDAGRIPGEFKSGWSQSGSKASANLSMSGANTERAPKPDSSSGRFPANLVLDEEAAAALDASTNVSAGTEKGASRFFYVAKASKADKNAGLDCDPKVTSDGRNIPIDNPYLRGKTLRMNTHPTVKSTKLMEYLIKLITPHPGTVLDPFMGSGTTGVAAERLGFHFIGIEKESDYVAISQKRIQFELSLRKQLE